jgi:hypothetical protein
LSGALAHNRGAFICPVRRIEGIQEKAMAVSTDMLEAKILSPFFQKIPKRFQLRQEFRIPAFKAIQNFN